MGEFASLLLAITAFGALVTVIVCLYRPPPGLKSFKFKDAALEFADPIPALTVTPARLQETSEPPTATEPSDAPAIAGAAAGAALVATTEPGYDDVVRAFKELRYEDGVALARRLTEADRVAWSQAGPFTLWLADTHGNPEAFPALRALAEASTGGHPALLYFGLILARHGDLVAAKRILSGALNAAGTDRERATAAVRLARLHSEDDETEAALSILSQTASLIIDPAIRAEVLEAAALTKRDPDEMFIFYELALATAPSNNDLRFSVAYKYAEKGANERALVHYRRVLEAEPSNAAALNNVGAAGRNLRLPLWSVEQQKAAFAAGHTLAASNLANALVDAGFKAEAVDILNAANRETDVHLNVASSAGHLAQAEATEESLLDAIATRALIVDRWRRRHGEALLRAVAPSAVAGSYVGAAAKITLSIDPFGKVEGSLVLAGTSAPLRVTGKLSGSALALYWTEPVPDTRTLRSMLGPDLFHAILIVGAVGELAGYKASGPGTLDGKELSGSANWSFKKES